MSDAPRPSPGTSDEPARSLPEAGGLRAWFAVMVRDGGLMRLAFPNRHRVVEGVWRSGQPGPGQLRRFARAGGRTVISLRAGRRVPALAEETETCRALGLAFHTLPLRGHRLPSAGELRTIASLFGAVERPVLLHCQWGADRAGFAAALWLLLVERGDVVEARRHLSARYGHNPLGRAGLLDALLDAYATNAARHPTPFRTWLETSYDPEAITTDWRTTSLPGRIKRLLGSQGRSRQPVGGGKSR